MPPYRVLVLDRNTEEVEEIRRVLQQNGTSVDVVGAESENDFSSAIDNMEFAAVLTVDKVDGFGGFDALEKTRQRRPDMPFVVLTSVRDRQLLAKYYQKGVTDVLPSSELWRLPFLLRHAVEAPPPVKKYESRATETLNRLVGATMDLSRARSLDDITRVIRHAARELVGADGASFVLREGDLSYYADEDAIAPTFKGMRFPMKVCIGGWAMINREQVVIKDVYQDERIPIEAYLPTYIKSLVMTPVRKQEPVAAIGVYWAREHEADENEISLLQTLADLTSLAMENVNLLTDLELRVRERTRELEFSNNELKAFSYSLSHDMQAPLLAVETYSGNLLEKDGQMPESRRKEYLQIVHGEAKRLTRMVKDMLRLFKLSRSPLHIHDVDISAISAQLLERLRADESDRAVELRVEPGITLPGDWGLFTILLQNLTANAWKFTRTRPVGRIEVGKTIGEKNETVVYVKDNGVGFDMKYAEKLFQPFQRFHSHEEFPGSGIGLATVDRIIRKHNGRVWAESEKEKGTTIYFTVPQVSPKAKAVIK